MKKHADILRPKFEAVLDVLERELGGLEIGSWISLTADTLSLLMQWKAAQRRSLQRRKRQVL